MKKQLAALTIIGLAAGCSSLYAGAPVNILWYTGGTEPVATAQPTASYEDNMNALAAQEDSSFNVSGNINPWNITYWTGGAIPSGSFNVLVVASPQGAWGSYPDYTSLTSQVSASSFGSRVMLTGQDADWHLQNYPVEQSGFDGAGTGGFNGPAGFLIDAINWAGSGTGLGAVFLGSTGLGMFSGIGSDLGGDNTVDIPAAFSSYPINVGLTSAGLSDWDTAAHTSFSGANPSEWTAINVGDDLDGAPITIVSAQSAGGGTGGGGTGVPDSASTLGLLGSVLAGIGAVRRKMKA